MIQCDFFDFPKPPADKLYDVVGLSLVVNFEGSLQKRGRPQSNTPRLSKNLR